METATKKTIITVKTTVDAPVEKVWHCFTTPEHIMQWNTASPDWHTPVAQNELREGGTFSYRMEAKDGSFGFDFGGVFDVVKRNEYLEYTIGDGRKVTVQFTPQSNQTNVTETFEAETMNSEEMQKAGWQAILDNFKKHTESE